MKGDGTIYKDEKRNRWIGQIVINGKRKSVTAKTKTDCKAKMQKLMAEALTGNYVENNDTTIKQIATFLIEDSYNMNKIGYNAYYRNKETLKALDDISYKPVQDVTEDDLRAFLISVTHYSNSYIKKIYGMLGRVFRYAMKKGIIIINPMDDVVRPNSSQKQIKTRALTLDEQKKLLKALESNSHFKTQIMTSMFTGMRMGEVNALMVKDINFDKNTISISRTMSRGEKGEAVLGDTTKTEAGTRVIPLPSSIKVLLIDECKNKKPNDMVFTNKGKLVTTSQVNSQINRLIAKYEIVDEDIEGKVTCHSLRHTYATRCIESGMDAKVLQYLLGHTDIRVTLNTYTDAFDEYRQIHLDVLDDYLKKMGIA